MPVSILVVVSMLGGVPWLRGGSSVIPSDRSRRRTAPYRCSRVDGRSRASAPATYPRAAAATDEGASTARTTRRRAARERPRRRPRWRRQSPRGGRQAASPATRRPAPGGHRVTPRPVVRTTGRCANARSPRDGRGRRRRSAVPPTHPRPTRLGRPSRSLRGSGERSHPPAVPVRRA